MDNYTAFSIETHLFFARIMKEHALFLEAGFPCKERSWIQRADSFRQQFEELLRQTVRLSDGMIGCRILDSQEIVTEFTIPAERRTSLLTGIAIDSRITSMEHSLRCGPNAEANMAMIRVVNQLNERAIRLLDGLIEFKEAILEEVKEAKLFTANYPLLIEHILREAKLYRSILIELRQNGHICRKKLRETEEFWNRIMMEHALFIRGLLDPSEGDLIQTADEFAMEYGKLLEMARVQDCKASEQLREKSLEETLRYREFKTAGAEGILECKIASIILPLLADHVLREANHFIRILECDEDERKC